jgi:HEAT repeat protein
MLTVRRIGLRTLLLGTLTAAGAPLAAGSLAGCGDENAPETHVAKLKDPATRPQAVNRLVQFFEDAMTKDNKNREGPNVKPILDKIVEPMNAACTAGDLDERTQSKIVKFLSDARDPRGEACLTKIMKDFKAEGGAEEDTRWAVRATGAMKLKGASGALFEVYSKLRPSKLKKVPELYRDVRDALVEIKDPAWESGFVEKLGAPINDRKDVANLKDQMFWQITAAEMLGNLRSAAGVKPLIKVVLSPMKADAAATAVNALVKIGKPAIAPALAVLKGEDKELVEYSKVENLKGAQPGTDNKPPPSAVKAAEVAHIGGAAIILGTIGREEAAGPMIEAMEKSDDLPRAIIARELAKLPDTPTVVAAFQSAFEKTPATLSIPPGLGARESMLEAAGSFFDANFVPWIVRTAQGLKGEEGDIAPIKEASLLTAAKLMRHDQVAVVESLFDMKSQGADGKASTLGKGMEKEWGMAKAQLTACTDKVECYLAKLAEPASQAKETQFNGIKAAYMVGVHGTPDSRQKLIDLMPKLSNAAVRFVAVSVIDHLSPKGDKDIADKLQKIVDQGEESKDQNTISGNAPFKTIIYRLQARAQ